MTVIDTHQHYWDLERFQYHWIKPGTALSQNYLPTDILPHMQAAGVDSCVLVEAGVNKPGELHWFLELAAAHAHIAGVVGYIDLLSDVQSTLASINPEHRHYLKGVRVGISDPAADYSVYRPGLSVLAAHSLTCDLLIRNETLPQVAQLAQANPQVTFVLDHFAGATIRVDGYENWRRQLESVAALPNTVMKVSGYLTAADPKPPSLETLRPYFEIALKFFGPSRLMYGSDWPVCLVGDTYEAGVDLLKPLTSALMPDEQAAIWGRTAIKTYQL